MSEPSYKIYTSKKIWLYTPIIIFLLPYISNLLNFNSDAIYNEFGIIENLTVIFLIIGFVFGLRIIWNEHKNKWRKFWYILIILVTILFAGEEMSWGQHYFGWETSDAWKKGNTQDETNLHNLSSFNYLFSRLPNMLLSRAAWFGGCIIPIIFLLLKIKFNNKSINHWIWPSYTSIPTSILAYAVGLPVNIAREFKFELIPFLKIGEGQSKECFLALFICIYLIIGYKYTLQNKSA